MNSFKKDVVGFFEEPTTYKHDFINYPPQPVREMIKGYPAERIIPFSNKKSAPLLNTITSYDTLQKLNYKTRLPFDAMIKPKEIIGTHPQDTFCQRNTIDEGLNEAISTRPRLYVSPGISLDNVEDSETRRLMIDFTYMTTTGRAGKEAWSNFSHSESPCLPNTVFEKTVDPVKLRPQLVAEIPIENKPAANKQESKRERYFGDTTTRFLKNRENIDYEKRMAKLISKEEKEKVRSLIAKNKLRLPYDRMPLSYGGFRPQLAIGVPLEINDLSPFDPNVSVSRAISAYNNID